MRLYIVIFSILLISTTLSFAQNNAQTLTFDDAIIAEWSPDGQRIAVSTDTDLYMVNPDTAEVEHILLYDNPIDSNYSNDEETVHLYQMQSLFWSEDNKFIALEVQIDNFMGGYNSPDNLWVIDIENKKLIFDDGQVFSNCGIGQVAFSSNSDRVAQTCRLYQGDYNSESWIRILDLQSMTTIEIAQLRGKNASTYSIAWTSDNADIAVGTDGAVYIFDSKSGDEIRVLSAEANLLRHIYWTEDNRYMVTFGNLLRMWDAETGDVIFSIPVPFDNIHDGGYVVGENLQSPSDTTALVARNTQIYEIDIETGHVVAIIQPDTSETDYYSVMFSPDGTRASLKSLYTLMLTDTIRIDVPAPLKVTPQLVDTPFDGSLSGQLGWTPDGDLYAFDRDALTILSDIPIRKQVSIAQDTYIDRSIISSDMRYWAMSVNGDAVENTSVYVFDMVSNEQVCQFDEHTGDITSLEFSPDNTQLASGSIDTSLRLWDVTTCEPVHAFWGQDSPVDDIAFRRDGQFLASTGIEYIYLWDSTTGELEWRNYAFTEWFQDFDIGRISFELDDTYVIARALQYGIYDEETNYHETYSYLVGWDMANPLDNRDGYKFFGIIYDMLISPDQNYIAQTSQLPDITLHKLTDDFQIGDDIQIQPSTCVANLFDEYRIAYPNELARWMAFSPDSSLFAFTIQNGCVYEMPDNVTEEFDMNTIAIVETATGILHHQIFSDNENPVIQLLFSRDGEQLISRREDGTVHIISVSDGAILAEYPQ